MEKADIVLEYIVTLENQSRPVPKRQPKRQNFKAAAAARCVHTLNK